jgi:hypothetical protein
MLTDLTRESKTVHRNGHGHCPKECEHPQPFERDGKKWCGACFFEHETMTEMVPCTPEQCPDVPADQFVTTEPGE